MKVGDLVEFQTAAQVRPYHLDWPWRLGLLVAIEILKHDNHCRVFYNGKVIRIRQGQIK